MAAACLRGSCPVWVQNAPATWAPRAWSCRRRLLRQCPFHTNTLSFSPSTLSPCTQNYRAGGVTSTPPWSSAGGAEFGQAKAPGAVAPSPGPKQRQGRAGTLRKSACRRGFLGQHGVAQRQEQHRCSWHQAGSEREESWLSSQSITVTFTSSRLRQLSGKGSHAAAS